MPPAAARPAWPAWPAEPSPPACYLPPTPGPRAPCPCLLRLLPTPRCPAPRSAPRRCYLSSSTRTIQTCRCRPLGLCTSRTGCPGSRRWAPPFSSAQGHRWWLERAPMHTPAAPLAAASCAAGLPALRWLKGRLLQLGALRRTCCARRHPLACQPRASPPPHPPHPPAPQGHALLQGTPLERHGRPAGCQLLARGAAAAVARAARPAERQPHPRPWQGQGSAWPGAAL